MVSALRSRAFDWRYNIQTCGDSELDTLHISSGNALHGTPYIPTHPKAGRNTFENLPIQDFSRYTFIDFGSGKGRMLFIAAEFPFRKIIGVEFAPELHQIAVDNIRRYRNPQQKCFDLESVNCDAAEYPFPEGEMVLYFYFPFRKPVMEPLLARLDRSLEEKPRDVVLAYANPELANLVDQMRHMKLYTATPVLQHLLEYMISMIRHGVASGPVLTRR